MTFYRVVMAILFVGAIFLIPVMWRGPNHEWPQILKLVGFLVTGVFAMRWLRQSRAEADERRKALQQAATESWSEPPNSSDAE